MFSVLNTLDGNLNIVFVMQNISLFLTNGVCTPRSVHSAIGLDCELLAFRNSCPPIRHKH